MTDYALEILNCRMTILTRGRPVTVRRFHNDFATRFYSDDRAYSVERLLTQVDLAMSDEMLLALVIEPALYQLDVRSFPQRQRNLDAAIELEMRLQLDCPRENVGEAMKVMGMSTP